ncbi:MAG: YihY/virulence factor BrkB family protein [Bacteroidetes bacterium]|nr:YihY/virulence factor BrkB family protein [Bacteroidota bacterium]
MLWFHQLLLRYFIPYRWLCRLLAKVPFPGNRKKNMGEVLGFFLLKIPDESITTKASAIAFNFFLALFPALIVLFGLIPFVPLPGLQDEIMVFFREAMPSNAYDLISDTLQDIIVTRRGGLLSITSIITIYFASNGFNALLAALDPSGDFWSQKLKSVGLMFLVALLVITAVGISITSEVVFVYFQERIAQLNDIQYMVLRLSKWAILGLLTYFSVALVFHTGTPRANRLHFFSPGASLSTLSILLISYGFGYYVDHFGQYNKFYGSLGALIVTLLWMYLCALVLMIWYVYNKSHHNFK